MGGSGKIAPTSRIYRGGPPRPIRINDPFSGVEKTDPVQSIKEALQQGALLLQMCVLRANFSSQA